MAMGGDGDDGTMLSEINVTPLVDVMLVLLIIFMVTAPMIEQGVDIDLPKAEAKTLDPDEKKLVLFIDDQRRIFLGQTFIPFSVLQAKLQHNEKLKAEKELYLKADQGLPYGLVVKVMAIAKNAGIDRVNMITEGAPGKLRGAESEAGYTTEETTGGEPAGKKPHKVDKKTEGAAP
ncbi:MAG: ExbD/TolR family protein [Deltaproteobacteria bacterium]|nr:ExbD/TolR family protein [Deltaproteobacteria bacterium]